jgi:hypothetical protein
MTPSAAPPHSPCCAACGRPLSAAQLSKNARACSGTCRRQANRARQRAAVLAHIDRVEAAQARRDAEVAAELRELRAQVARLG